MTGKFTLAALCLLAGTAHAASPAATDARNLAANCTPCHSADTPEPNAIPRIAGLPAAKILHRLQAFRNGEAPATVMHQIVRGYSDHELALIANHLAIPAIPASDKR
ncbi:cytochrome C [Aromatoleum evansii]|uniref:Cytochrome C n=1 Tax=Aromatoleum evansii TaxID=59406 RepID=A0ABZ1AHC0_AROEV|nr:cytochrome C [Aromatoleum evansii]